MGKPLVTDGPFANEAIGIAAQIPGERYGNRGAANLEIFVGLPVCCVDSRKLARLPQPRRRGRDERGIEAGLKRIDDLDHRSGLDQYYLFHAARADLLRRLNRYRDAAAAYEQAASLATNNIELDFLKRRLHQMEALL